MEEDTLARLRDPPGGINLSHQDAVPCRLEGIREGI
jgi:hypothetical protein